MSETRLIVLPKEAKLDLAATGCVEAAAARDEAAQDLRVRIGLHGVMHMSRRAVPGESGGKRVVTALHRVDIHDQRRALEARCAQKRIEPGRRRRGRKVGSERDGFVGGRACGRSPCSVHCRSPSGPAISRVTEKDATRRYINATSVGPIRGAGCGQRRVRWRLSGIWSR